jgi:acetate kinase
MSNILTINSGSSSLKFSVYDMGRSEALILSGEFKRIGLSHSVFSVEGHNQETVVPSHDVALQTLFGWLASYNSDVKLDAVGHRLVYGGLEYHKPQLITPTLENDLKKLIPFAPDHLPEELKAIEAVKNVHPRLPQVVCFDTAFHWESPKIAKLYPLPRDYWDEGLRRYGFHGLSYAYILQELTRKDGAAGDGRIVVAHLGNGASMAAIRNRTPVDTTMGMTPSGGLMMGTRSGDLDPGAVFYVLNKGSSVDAAKAVLNDRAGLLGLSGISSDMQDLLSKETIDQHAADAIELFCYQARKFLGSLVAVLGGLDTLVFTAGIGQHAPSVRSRICEGLEFLGIRLDSQLNNSNASVISTEESPVQVRVMKTNEEIMIARYTNDVISKAGASIVQ